MWTAIGLAWEESPRPKMLKFKNPLGVVSNVVVDQNKDDGSELLEGEGA